MYSCDMKNLKVLHISRGFEDYVISLANEVSEFVDLHVVLTDTDKWVEQHLNRMVQIYFSNAPRVSDFRNIRAMFRLCQYIKRLNPDVIHLQNGVVWEALLPLFFRKIKFITTIHDVTIHPNRGGSRFTPQIVLDTLVRYSDGLIVHGKNLCAATLARHGADKAKYLQVISHPIISRYGIAQARSNSAGRILFFGTLDEWKGIEYLLAAMEIVSTQMPDVILKIAGGSSTPNYYRNLPYKYDNIQWNIRRQSDTDVKNLFEWADILVLPYIEASQSGVLHVAQSFGMPIVATRTGALEESIADGETGLLVTPKSAPKLAAAIYRLLLDIELRTKVIQNITQHRDKQLLNKTVGQQTFSFYRKIVDENARG